LCLVALAEEEISKERIRLGERPKETAGLEGHQEAGCRFILPAAPFAIAMPNPGASATSSNYRFFRQFNPSVFTFIHSYDRSC
jgi:hypothetical protein